MPLLSGKAVSDVDGPGDRLADLAGVVEDTRHDVLPDAHGCHCDATVRRRSCGVAGLFVQPELLQRPVHGMCDTMRREMLLALDQSRSRPAREEEWQFARQLRCLPEELHSHRRERDGMISTVFHTPCRDQPLRFVEIDLRLKCATDLSNPLACNEGEPKRYLGPSCHPGIVQTDPECPDFGLRQRA